MSGLKEGAAGTAAATGLCKSLAGYWARRESPRTADCQFSESLYITHTNPLQTQTWADYDEKRNLSRFQTSQKKKKKSSQKKQNSKCKLPNLVSHICFFQLKPCSEGHSLLFGELKINTFFFFFFAASHFSMHCKCFENHWIKNVRRQRILWMFTSSSAQQL